MPLDRVHVLSNFYDGPLSGIADCDGQIQVFERQFDEAQDDYSSEFRLMPIDAALLALALEQHAIFLRWRAWFHETKPSEFLRPHPTPEDIAHSERARDTHPALPEDRPRYDELSALIGNRLDVRLESSITRLARFDWTEGEENLKVEWIKP